MNYESFILSPCPVFVLSTLYMAIPSHDNICAVFVIRCDSEARDGARKHHDFHRGLYRLTQHVCADYVLLQGDAAGGVFTLHRGCDGISRLTHVHIKR